MMGGKAACTDNSKVLLYVSIPKQDEAEKHNVDEL
jgi:hypothetical protein